MDEINIDGVSLTSLKIIEHPKGDILHGLKKSNEGFFEFGEAYFSVVNQGEIKGWTKHKLMTLNLLVPTGEVSFVIYDDRSKKGQGPTFFKVELSPNNYKRLTVNPGLWMAFRGNSPNTNLVLNLADIEHDSTEYEKLELDEIPYNWESF